MESTTWRQRIHAITHILTATPPTEFPPLHSQLFVAAHVPCYLTWDFPPFLCPSPPSFPPLLLRWSVSLFLKRASRLGLPGSSWRSKCPFQIPPPAVLCSAVDPAPERWSQEQRRAYFQKRLRRGRIGLQVNPVLAVCVPNMLLFSLLLWDPLSIRDV